MYRFFSAVVAPILAASQARRVIEIGAATGQQSAKAAQWCSRHEASLDIIDPAPQFDSDAFLSRWTCSRFHRALSLEALPGLLPADVVLVDGDHNWYTVFHEMRLMYGDGETIADDAPIAICHDVEFPYGRRDLYYDIETIPPAYRQPAGPGALNPLFKGFAPVGMNSILCNARTEGGPRNGVRTAIEDALDGRRGQLRIVWLPVLNGLAIIVPKCRIAVHPALGEVLDQIEPAPPLKGLMKIVEQERIHGQIAQQSVALLSGATLDQPSPATPSERPFTSAIQAQAWRKIQRGALSQTYKGRALLLSPFDMANYLQLLGDLRPGCVIEVGAYEGGRTLWLADSMAALGLSPKVIAVDLVPPKGVEAEGVTVLAGDALDLQSVLPDEVMAALPRPLLVIEDSAHTRDVTAAVLEFFDPQLRAGDYIVVEDAVVQTLLEAKGPVGVAEAITDFMERRGGHYELNTGICDRFGYNVTRNPNGWLRRR